MAKPEYGSAAWWRAAARLLDKDSPGHVYCKVMAVAEEGSGGVLLSTDQCMSMALDDAVETHAHICAEEVMEGDDGE